MLNGRQILVMEDETLLRKSLCHYLESKGAEVFPAGNIEEARRIRESTELDYALLDINLPDGNGLDLLDKPGFSDNTRIVMMTADGGIRTAIEAMRRGASDYLSKPFDPEELPMVFSRIAREGARQRKEQFERDTHATPGKSLFTGARLRFIESQLDKILEADARLGSALPPVLIEGETGTGKSTLARWLHQHGPRKEAPLIEINCSALPESLVESELFGHERGAFTDARKERIGLFEAADGGTLFLDEIASLSLPIQAKVLTAIEDGHIRRVGGNAQRKIDVRLIAASLHSLDKLVREGSFREDLYHRLNLLHIRIPSLREFPDDIPALARHLLDDLKKRYRFPEATISTGGMQRLAAQPWPGNVRELIHEIERSLVFQNSGSLEFESLADPAGGNSPEIRLDTLKNPYWSLPETGFDFEAALKDLTKDVIEEALDQENGNVSAAARRLGVPRDFIRYRIDS
ncbi:sigma-54-dependent Fis family transcriptional regulator [Puniceicoccales bacterium CK1056]|uniref:Sigma-54-dependent Fis family transcriptional regulator n=1 Tax=Oceanipulchritudo coccoides TaxID=2706888 RepID=A0A6B2LZF1_9BACT|nr:sigma-54 dependent transcriptional regulator [Oceanipulchritudo coccoides]NDV62038.1 sigma-54-dependent Fis family transcriptional regulator [Oceanipulchritudo coccoides]